jgi:signal-transduction protein with cAMP-binding, CBS, and nucleotidyltransferase domain
LRQGSRSFAEELNPLFETAQSALEKSCYLKIDWKIEETEPVSEAVKRMVAHDIGALAVTEKGSDVVIGVLSERDYLNKVAFLGIDPKETTVGAVSTTGDANLVTVTRGNPIDRCMEKMLARDIRHLLVRREEDDVVIGMISIKDVVKCAHMKSLAKYDHLERVIQTQTLVSTPY